MSGRRIAQVIGTTTGGIGTHVASLATGLSRRGDRVTVYGPAETETRFGFRAGGARFVPIEISREPHPTRDAAAILALRKALRGVGGATPDVVHAHGLRAGGAARLAKPADSALVVTWHTHLNPVGWKGKALRGAEITVARGADVCLCTDPDQIGHLIESGARDARYLAVAAPELPEPATDPETVKRGLDAADRPLILAVGRLHPVKRFDVLIDAATRWRDLNPRPLVVIAGDGPIRAELDERIARTGAPVRLLGHRDDMADLLAAADIATVTSDSEARQMFAQEAIRSRTPLVATDSGGTAALVGDGAELIPAGDVAALDAAVRRLLDSPQAARDLVAAAEKQAASWPSAADTIDGLDALYQELTGR